MTILVIDDSRFVQLAIDKALREAGYRTIIVGDGEQGLNIAIQQSPDLILLDIMLPSMPGTSVLRSLKKNVITSGIPVIVLTSLGRLDAERLEQEGADGYLAKADLNLNDGCEALIQIIQTFIKKHIAINR
jgi:two-component system, OmpR family, alkaline phosphatase synthesis response regulator PhoP